MIATGSSKEPEQVSYDHGYIETSPDYYQSMDGGGGFSYLIGNLPQLAHAMSQ
jgi:hypothetical protein